MIRNLEQTMVEKIKTAKEEVNAKLYRKWINTSTIEERELIHAQTAVLNDVVFALTKAIRQDHGDM